MADHMEADFTVNDFTSTLSSHAGISPSAPPRDPRRRPGHAHPVETTQCDHDYCKTGGRQDAHNKMTRYKVTPHKMTRDEDVGRPSLNIDHDALYYVGIALDVFNILVTSLEGSNAFPMSVRDQVLLTLVTLKTNRDIGYLAERFCVSESMAGEIVSYWIDKLEHVLRPVVPWLPRETIEATTPRAFRESFPNASCVLEFCQSFVQKPSNLDSRGGPRVHCYDTVKYVVAVAPCGLIMFISGAYMAHSSDKLMVLDSGLLGKLKPGDVFMTQHQYSSRNQEYVSSTSHVAAALHRLKVYKILSHVVSKSMAPQINKILTICSALVNLRYDVVQ
ncbi:uncharacterized protein si:dkey-56d12.4 isoform X2 [Cebidichthys violaceus]|uniref:uncharacterized protein si:dkey-56d12.4 isoform X2 n=1 Tax=Cebidichthys violaceus TaxID=271503 RepID=UPI0035CAEA26